AARAWRRWSAMPASISCKSSSISVYVNRRARRERRENLRSACSALSAVKRGLASRQIEIDHVSAAAQARHPLLDHRAAAVGGGGKALIEIRADSQVVPERLA